MSLSIRIKDCLDNHEAYVATLTTMPDKELAKKLDLVHIQMEIAEQKTNTAALELLEIWHHQIIEARIFKAENRIADAPNEMELAIADIETVEAQSEQRQEILKDFALPGRPASPKIKKPQDAESQLPLF